MTQLQDFNPHIVYRECLNQFVAPMLWGVVSATLALLAMAAIPFQVVQFILSIPALAGVWITLSAFGLYHAALQQWQVYYTEWKTQVSHDRDVEMQGLEIKVGGKNNTVNLNPTTNTLAPMFVEGYDLRIHTKHFFDFIQRAKFLRQVGGSGTTGYERNSYLITGGNWKYPSDGQPIKRDEYETFVEMVEATGLNSGRKKGFSGRAVLDVSPKDTLELSEPSQPSQASQVNL